MRVRSVAHVCNREGAVMCESCRGGMLPAMKAATPKSDSRLPQTQRELSVSDGGLETDLIFHHNVDLPCFATVGVFPQRDLGEGKRIELKGHERSFPGGDPPRPARSATEGGSRCASPPGWPRCASPRRVAPLRFATRVAPLRFGTRVDPAALRHEGGPRCASARGWTPLRFGTGVGLLRFPTGWTCLAPPSDPLHFATALTRPASAR